MDILFVIIKLAMVAIVLYWVGWPLFRSDQPSSTRWWKLEIALLDTPQKDVVLDTLNEIEFDHSTGKLNDEDYHNLKAEYELMAVKIFEEEENEMADNADKIEGLESDLLGTDDLEDIDQEIERELERLRQQQKGGSGEHA